MENTKPANPDDPAIPSGVRNILKNCWKIDPRGRPRIEWCGKRLRDLLEDPSNDTVVLHEDGEVPKPVSPLSNSHENLQAFKKQNQLTEQHTWSWRSHLIQRGWDVDAISRQAPGECSWETLASAANDRYIIEEAIGQLNLGEPHADINAAAFWSKLFAITSSIGEGF